MADAFDAPGTVKPFGIFSSAAWQPEGKVLHVSGQVAQDATGSVMGKGDIRAQTRQVLENIRTVLASAGGTMDDVARVTVYVTGMSGLAQLHRGRGQGLRRRQPAHTAGYAHSRAVRALTPFGGGPVKSKSATQRAQSLAPQATLFPSGLTSGRQPGISRF